LKILIVEDDPISLKLISSILEKGSFEVIKMKSATRAMGYLQTKGLVDIIISDIMLPELNGFKFLKLLKANKQLKKIPVILCTSVDDKRAVLKGISLGAVDYIAKPVDANILLSKVNNVLKSLPGAVLVVDDEKLYRECLVGTVAKAGFKSLVAGSGKEALQLMNSNKVSVVLSDIRMPEMSGYELLIEVKDRYPNVRMLLMSGYTDSADKNNDLRVKPDGFITKPFHNVDIISKLEKFV
jgi:CheY-like chemotaxis protein